LIENEQVAPAPRDLKHECLSYVEVLSQSISVIAPSTVPAAILGLIFAVAGNGTWLSFVLGMVGLIFVGFNINQFARRSASPGSLYTYIVSGLGPTAGVLSGWALAFGYPAALYLSGVSAFDGQGYFGSLCTFGFLVVYILISIAAPIYLLSLGVLTRRLCSTQFWAPAS
jgi:amino acid transporter